MVTKIGIVAALVLAVFLAAPQRIVCGEKNASL